MKKRIISFAVALLMILSILPTAVFAAETVSITVGTATVEPGKTATVDVNIAGASAAALMAAYFEVDFDSALTLSNVSLSDAATQAGFAFGQNNLSNGIIQIDGASAGSNIEDGVFFTMEFTASETASGSYSVSIKCLNDEAENVNDGNDAVPCSFTPGTVTVKSTAVEGYTATLTTSASGNEVVSESGITVNVAVSHSSEAVFNAGEIKLSYDGTKLTPDVAYIKDTLKLSYDIENAGAANAVLTIEDFGTDKAMSYNYGIPFTASSVDTETTTDVTVTRAAFIHKDNANKSDLIEATKSPKSLTVTIKVAMVKVTLTNSADKNDTTTVQTQKGQDYTFTPEDTANYTYSDVSATVGGKSVTVTPSTDGKSFTINGDDVTDDIAITYTKTAKSYTAKINTVWGETTTTEEKTATYGTNFEFSVPENESAGTNPGYTYALSSVTINGIAYTGYEADGNNYTIPGTAITGEIVITITKTEVPANTFTVSVEGNAAGDATINNENNLVAKDGTASITVTTEPGYSYTVTATMGGANATVTQADNTYSVANVSGNVVFTVTKTLNGTKGIYQYVTLNTDVAAAGTMWLVTYEVELDGKVPTYAGNKMFYSEKYNAYCWLVIADTADEVTGEIDVVELAEGETATNVNYSMNINGVSSVIDAADAQLVWNMYSKVYSDFSVMTMAQFLAADQNGDATSETKTVDDAINVDDAAKIISAILDGSAK